MSETTQEMNQAQLQPEKKHHQKWWRITLAVLFLFFPVFHFLSSCSSIDCPLNSRILCRYGVLSGSSADTLTISTKRMMNGNDTVLINKQVNTTEYALPISNGNEEDIFFYEIADTLGTTTLDTVWVSKEDTPRFEGVECAPQYTHQLKTVRYTTHGIDRIAIQNNQVDNDQTKLHLQIYFIPRY